MSHLNLSRSILVVFLMYSAFFCNCKSLTFARETIKTTTHIPEAHWKYHASYFFLWCVHDILYSQAILLEFGHGFTNHLVLGLTGEHQRHQHLITPHLQANKTSMRHPPQTDNSHTPPQTNNSHTRKPRTNPLFTSLLPITSCIN